MTEDEAKTKWCPFAMAAPRASTTPGINRYEKGEPAGGTSCIASACMAWRKTTDASGSVLERRDMGVAPPPDGWLRSSKDHPDTLNKSFGDWIRFAPPKATGFCGLAGAPQ